MRDAVNRFARAYTVGIVGVGRESLYAESKMFLRTPTANERLGTLFYYNLFDVISSSPNVARSFFPTSTSNK